MVLDRTSTALSELSVLRERALASWWAAAGPEPLPALSLERADLAGGAGSYALVRFPAPQQPTEAYFAAIVYQRASGARYFVCERSADGGAFWSEWSNGPMGRMRIRGENVAADAGAFTQTVLGLAQAQLAGPLGAAPVPSSPGIAPTVAMQVTPAPVMSAPPAYAAPAGPASPAAPKKGPPWLLIGGVGCLGALVVCCCLPIGGFFGGNAMVERDVRAAVESWLASVRAGDLATAHANTDSYYRMSNTVSDLTRDLASCPALLTHTSVTIEEVDIDMPLDDFVIVRSTLQDPVRGAYVVSMGMEREDGTWRVGTLYSPTDIGCDFH